MKRQLMLSVLAAGAAVAARGDTFTFLNGEKGYLGTDDAYIRGSTPTVKNGLLMDSMDGSTVLLRTSEDAAPHKRPQLTLKVVRLPPLGTMLRVE